MSDAATSASTTPGAPGADLPAALCRELAEAADAVAEAARYASRLALGARLPATVLGPGGTRRSRRLAWRTLLRTLSDPAGLGWAPRGRGVARAGWLAGVLTGRESLAVSLAVCGLRVRIRKAGADRPELWADPGSAAVLTAVDEGRQAEAARLFRGLLRERGPQRAYALLAPAFPDILAWRALTDENPFNDHAGWQIATGRARPAVPLLGLGAAVRAFVARGPRGAGPTDGDRALLTRLDTTGTLAGYARNSALTATGGAVLVQRVIGSDGVLRHVVLLPRTPRTPAGRGPTPRAVARAVRRLVPSGTELALVGHGPGGATALHLAADRDFTAVYALTRVIAVGAPAASPEPADPRTRVVVLPAEHAPEAEAADAALADFRGRVTASRLLRLPDC